MITNIKKLSEERNEHGTYKYTTREIAEKLKISRRSYFKYASKRGKYHPPMKGEGEPEVYQSKPKGDQILYEIENVNKLARELKSLFKDIKNPRVVSAIKIQELEGKVRRLEIENRKLRKISKPSFII